MIRNKKKTAKVKRKSQTGEKYKNFCYKLFGKSFDKPEKYEGLSEKLKMANMKYTPPVFLSIIILTGIIVTIISFIIYLIAFNIVIQSRSWIMYVLFLTMINAVISFTFLPMLMRLRISTRKLQIEHELPFILSELSILASTGLTPIKIVRHMAQRGGNTGIYLEFKKLVHKIDIEGKDIVSAISETAQETPSEIFKETLWDLSNMIHQGGDLDEYLRQKADHTLQLRRNIQKEFIEKLGTYAEMYISLALIGVLFIGIAAFLLDALGTTISGIDSETLLLILAYGIVPTVAIVVIVIISTAYTKSA